MKARLCTASARALITLALSGSMLNGSWLMKIKSLVCFLHTSLCVSSTHLDPKLQYSSSFSAQQGANIAKMCNTV